MSTIGKRFVDRTHDRSAQRIVDTRMKVVLSAVLAEPSGSAMNTYLKAGPHTPSKPDTNRRS